MACGGNGRLLAVVTAAAAIAALTLTALVAVSGAPLPGDVRWARFIQAQSSFATIANLVNFIGDWNWLLFAVFVLTLAATARPWRRGLPSAPYREALGGLVTVIALRFFDQLLKFLLQSPRPSGVDGIRLDGAFGSYGFPSGHVYGDVVFLGAMAVYALFKLPPLLRLATRLLLIAFIILAGPARVYVGAPRPSDVMGGYLWGVAVLGLGILIGQWAPSANFGCRDRHHELAP